jgi:hypothetical protein
MITIGKNTFTIQQRESGIEGKPAVTYIATETAQACYHIEKWDNGILVLTTSKLRRSTGSSKWFDTFEAAADSRKCLRGLVAVAAEAGLI